MESFKPSKLVDIYRYVSPRDFSGNLRAYDALPSGLTAASDVPTVSEVVPFLQNLVVDGSNNGFADTDSIVKATSEFVAGADPDLRDALSRRFLLVSDLPVELNAGIPKLAGFKLTSLAPGLDDPKVVATAALIGSPKVGISLRNVNDVTTFARAIPTHELSRCVPYINVRFVFPARSPLRGEDGTTRSVSIIRFLRGGADVTDRPADMLLTDPTTKLDGGATLGLGAAAAVRGTSGASGMDLFLAPQTMQLWDEPANRYNPVADPTRPFMSIGDLAVKCIALTGTIQYKTAELSVTLHDRSRLPEIVQLVKPELHGKTLVDIEYGWSHPDGPGSDNVYGEFMNRMRTREIYMIRASGYSFSQSGEMKISLSLAMKGAVELQRTRVSGDTAEQRLRELTSAVGELRRALNLAVPGDPRASQILDAAERGERPADVSQFEPELNKLLAALKSGSWGRRAGAGAPSAEPAAKAAGELADKLEQLYTKNGQDEKKKNLTFKEAHQRQAVQQVLGKLGKCGTGVDPFFPDPGDETKYPRFPFGELISQRNKSSPDDPKGVNEIVSFGKAFTVFAVDAMKRALGNEIDEIQVFYYPLSTGAGRASGTSLAMFPIEMKTLRAAFEAKAQASLNADMSVYDFVNLVNEKVFADPRSLAYGIADLYVPVGKDTKEPQMKKTRDVQNVGQFSRALEERLANFGGIFKAPVVKVLVETQPKRTGQYTVDPDTMILRVHVFDAQTDAHDAALQVFKSLTLQPASFLGAIDEDSADVKRFIEQFKQSADALKVLGFRDVRIDEETVGGRSSLHVDGDLAAIKAAIAKLLPTIVYGQNGSIIIDTPQLTTQQNALIAAGNMRAQGSNQGFQPNGSAMGGIPLTVIPGEMTLTTFGCSWASIGQRMFIDLGTGTQLDNVYVCTGLDHRIGPGKFETVWKFAWSDAYPAYTSFVRSVARVQQALSKASAGA